MLARRTDLTNKTQAHLPVSTMASNAPPCLQFSGGREPGDASHESCRILGLERLYRRT